MTTTIAASTTVGPAEREKDRHAPRHRPGIPLGFALTLLLLGVGLRAVPLLDEGGRLLHQWPTEDGYLMLTIARNIAIGSGMSTAAGTIPTNGTQPLCTVLWAGCYTLVGGDKTAGVLLVLIASLIIAGAGAYLLYRTGRTALLGWTDGGPLAAVAAGLWFISPNSARQTMNCLETGLATALLVACAWFFISSWRRHAAWSFRRCVAFGGLLGLAFWARIDACWFVGAACLVRLVGWLPAPRVMALRRRSSEVLTFGASSVIVACPWLIYNQLRFGSIMPVSGTAQSHSADFAENLVGVPAAVAEYVTVVGQIPSALERVPIVIIGCVTLVLAAVAIVARSWSQLPPTARVGVALTGTWGILLVTWYGLFFGAGHFLSRYLFPLSPFLALFLAAALWRGTARLAPRVMSMPRGVALAAVVLVALGLNIRQYRQGTEHMHFQVVEWVQANVPTEAWVGAVQTGTLGYYHDRTINLDGKVNPRALEAQLRHALPEYIISTPIQYLADWVGIAGKGYVLDSTCY